MDIKNKPIMIDLNNLLPNRHQPNFKVEENFLNVIKEVREKGVVEPIIVQRLGEKYEVIKGYEFVKASKKLGFRTIPAIISNLSEKENCIIALIDYAKHNNLDSVEKAISYKKILDYTAISIDELASRLGISVIELNDTLKILNLDESVHEALMDELLSYDYVNPLLKIPSKYKQKEILIKILNNQINLENIDKEIEKMNNNTKEILNFDMPDEPIIGDEVEQSVNSAISPDFENVRNGVSVGTSDIPTISLEEPAKIEDTFVNAGYNSNPGFMDIDSIANNAQDIFANNNSYETNTNFQPGFTNDEILPNNVSNEQVESFFGPAVNDFSQTNSTPEANEFSNVFITTPQPEVQGTPAVENNSGFFDFNFDESVSTVPSNDTNYNNNSNTDFNNNYQSFDSQSENNINNMTNTNFDNSTNNEIPFNNYATETNNVNTYDNTYNNFETFNNTSENSYVDNNASNNYEQVNNSATDNIYQSFDSFAPVTNDNDFSNSNIPPVIPTIPNEEINNSISETPSNSVFNSNNDFIQNEISMKEVSEPDNLTSMLDEHKEESKSLFSKLKNKIMPNRSDKSDAENKYSTVEFSNMNSATEDNYNVETKFNIPTTETPLDGVTKLDNELMSPDFDIPFENILDSVDLNNIEENIDNNTSTENNGQNYDYSDIKAEMNFDPQTGEPIVKEPSLEVNPTPEDSYMIEDNSTLIQPTDNMVEVQEEVPSLVGTENVDEGMFKPIVETKLVAEEDTEEPEEDLLVPVQEVDVSEDIIEEEKEYTFDDVMEAINECKNSIEKMGFSIKMENFDFEDMFQSVFRIIKK